MRDFFIHLDQIKTPSRNLQKRFNQSEAIILFELYVKLGERVSQYMPIWDVL